MLVPARTGSDEFHDYFSKGAVRFIGGLEVSSKSTRTS